MTYFETVFVRGVGFTLRTFEESGRLDVAVRSRHGAVTVVVAGNERRETSLEAALAATKGVTDGVSVFVPYLLLGREVHGEHFNAARPGSAGAGCGRCWEVFVESKPLQSVMTFDEATSLVRRLEQVDRASVDGVGHVRTTILFRPEFEGLDAKVLEELVAGSTL